MLLVMESKPMIAASTITVEIRTTP